MTQKQDPDKMQKIPGYDIWTDGRVRIEVNKGDVLDSWFVVLGYKIGKSGGYKTTYDEKFNTRDEAITDVKRLLKKAEDFKKR